MFCVIIDLMCKGKQSERCSVVNLRLLISSECFSSGEARVKRLEEGEEEEEDDEESLSSFDWFWVCFNPAAERDSTLERLRVKMFTFVFRQIQGLLVINQSPCNRTAVS